MDDNGYVALSEKVTATFYDDEHEEWTQKTMTIADILDSVCDDYTIIPSAQSEIKTDGDMISRQQTIDALMQEFKRIPTNSIRAKLVVENLPSAQPERTKRIIGKSRDGMTMWYQCESCNEPVDEKDLFCSGCGRKFEDE